ncbi:SigE family RNA polymerase sigma factor [Actinocorallia sp. A-T 12471]|uniref:SigE family RNA polymerase sigma factor n=1 Tax=Actinocorallia sp. A-T 12471 TaxID=3089813 RepID=UPI0029D38F46|nr:SigE family RNA polymerase sigma factor [Actinocorallia sp. A-T 12471]MDX6742284.1 SigE family RNA polymerase sigma factor [Actinocorallia sp. A-T 12471]
MSADEEYTAYVTSRTLWLRRVAYLLCQDWNRADDLVQTAVTRLYLQWRRASQADSLDAYTRTVLVRVFLSEQRTGWWKRAVVTDAPPDAARTGPDLALDLRAALAALAPRQRAAVVLRFYCDMSIEDTANALGCTEGTVKSHTSRALTALRRSLAMEGNPL